MRGAARAQAFWIGIVLIYGVVYGSFDHGEKKDAVKPRVELVKFRQTVTPRSEFPNSGVLYQIRGVSLWLHLQTRLKWLRATVEGVLLAHTCLGCMVQQC